MQCPLYLSEVVAEVYGEVPVGAYGSARLDDAGNVGFLQNTVTHSQLKKMASTLAWFEVPAKKYINKSTHAQ